MEFVGQRCRPASHAIPDPQGAVPRMAHGAHRSPLLPPRPDPALARDCDQCLGWGTVVTRDGKHELCQACQPGPGQGKGGAARS